MQHNPARQRGRQAIADPGLRRLPLIDFHCLSPVRFDHGGRRERHSGELRVEKHYVILVRFLLDDVCNVSVSLRDGELELQPRRCYMLEFEVQLWAMLRNGTCLCRPGKRIKSRLALATTDRPSFCTDLYM